MVKPQGGEVMSEVITLMVIILLIVITIKEKEPHLVARRILKLKT